MKDTHKKKKTQVLITYRDKEKFASRSFNYHLTLLVVAYKIPPSAFLYSPINYYSRFTGVLLRWILVGLGASQYKGVVLPVYGSPC